MHVPNLTFGTEEGVPVVGGAEHSGCLHEKQVPGVLLVGAQVVELQAPPVLQCVEDPRKAPLPAVDDEYGVKNRLLGIHCDRRGMICRTRRR